MLEKSIFSIFDEIAVNRLHIQVSTSHRSAVRAYVYVDGKISTKLTDMSARIQELDRNASPEWLQISARNFELVWKDSQVNEIGFECPNSLLRHVLG